MPYCPLRPARHLSIEDRGAAAAVLNKCRRCSRSFSMWPVRHGDTNIGVVRWAAAVLLLELAASSADTSSLQRQGSLHWRVPALHLWALRFSWFLPLD